MESSSLPSSFSSSSTGLTGISSPKEFIELIQHRLPDHILVRNTDDGRIYYWNQKTRTSSWLPPPDLWESENSDMPYGWEMAIDGNGKVYFINHLNKTTTYEDPRKSIMNTFPCTGDRPDSSPREVMLTRDPELGFGFVVGSERPVIIRFVKDGGPSEGKLIAGDQILKVNGEDMFDAPREEIIRRVKCSEDTVILTVCQPDLASYQAIRRSALMTEEKKARLKFGQPRVRFSERISIDGNPLFNQSSLDSPLPVVSNVLKVYLENNQTRTFKYDTSTTVQNVLDSLISKLGVQCPQYYTLCTEHIRSHGITKLTILSPEDTLWKVAAKPGAHSLRCILRMTFVSTEIDTLLTDDPVSFDYLYDQCCNDFVQERYSTQLDYDTMINLCALHLLQLALANATLVMSRKGKVDMKKIDKSWGLEFFLPASMIASMKRKDLYKLLSHYIKELQIKFDHQATIDQCKVSYLEIISSLPGYGAKAFPLNAKDNTCGACILISPKFGLSQLHRGVLRQSAPATLAQFDEIRSIHVTRDEELGFRVEMVIDSNAESKHSESGNDGSEAGESIDSHSWHTLSFIFDEIDVEEFVMCLRGYHRLFTGNKPDYREIEVTWDIGDHWWTDSAPNYHGNHLVCENFWNYLPSFCYDNQDQNDGDGDKRYHQVNFFIGPPCFESRKRTRKTSVFSSLSVTLSSSSSSSSSSNDSRRLNSIFKNRLKNFNISSLVKNSAISGRKRSSLGSEDDHSTINEDFLILCDEVSNKPADRTRVRSFSVGSRPYSQSVHLLAVPETSNRRVSNTSTDSVDLNCSSIKAADSLDLLHQIHEQQTKDPPSSLSEDEKYSRNSSSISSSSSPCSSPSPPPTVQESGHVHPRHPTVAAKAISASVPMRSRSGSSFGLSTLDSLPEIIKSSSIIAETLQEYKNKTESTAEVATELQVPCTETTFYLGSDVIDLTSRDDNGVTGEMKGKDQNSRNSSNQEKSLDATGTESGDDSLSNQDEENNNKTAYHDNTSDASDSGIDQAESDANPPLFSELLQRTLSRAYEDEEEDDEDQLICFGNEKEGYFFGRSDGRKKPVGPRKSLEEMGKETMEKIENASRKAKKMYLLEIDEKREAYWES
ncbi:uncharacterized protein LOC141848975 isoform X2 [Brevipalpus obovatus]|uniref:uncharacterized protein LOC141848975 isoform X2 n=1 Tax=Brevipalpus obovatus TaxID=246614 RepID=UPI003D9F1EB2